jgi:hypothetical protein
VQNGTYYIILATIKLAQELKKMNFIIYGEPKICCIGFNHPQHQVSSIQKFMNERGWSISINQMPLCFHFSFTPLNSYNVDKMIDDFKDCMKLLSENGSKL